MRPTRDCTDLANCTTARRKHGPLECCTRFCSTRPTHTRHCHIHTPGMRRRECCRSEALSRRCRRASSRPLPLASQLSQGPVAVISPDGASASPSKDWMASSTGCCSSLSGDGAVAAASAVVAGDARPAACGGMTAKRCMQVWVAGERRASRVACGRAMQSPEAGASPSGAARPLIKWCVGVQMRKLVSAGGPGGSNVAQVVVQAEADQSGTGCTRQN